MIFDRLFDRLFPGLSARILTLYPGLGPGELEQFLTESDYARIRSFDNVYILPFLSRNGEWAKKCFGLGLSRLLIRNLMLLRDVSIRGPEDTPEAPCEAIHKVVEAQPRSSHVTGVASVGGDGYSLQVSIHRPGRPVHTDRVRQTDFPAFLCECSSAIAMLLGSKVGDGQTKAWSEGQPRDANSLIQLGKFHFDFKRQQRVERGRAAKDLLKVDPGFVVALWDYDGELPGAKQEYLAALRRDPYNAQLCFEAFCTIWTSKGPQPVALQFCRKAIELSPGHGKAHMCALRSTATGRDVAAFGTRLSAAARQFVRRQQLRHRLGSRERSSREEDRVGQRGNGVGPQKSGQLPASHRALCSSLGDHSTGLAIAERLQQLFEPTIDKRALYCLRQNPRIARLIDSGQYDPAAENRRRIAELCKRV